MNLDVKKTSYKNVMKIQRILPLIVLSVVLFMWSIREHFEDTESVQGPPYGRTPESAQLILDMMPPTLYNNLKTKMNVTSATLTDREKVKLVYADGNIISPISQVMGNFYWQIYKPATTTISLAQLNEFLENQPDSWIRANRADIREFLKRYFIQGQNGASQSGYGDIMNSVLGEKILADSKKETKTEVKTEVKTESTNTDRIVLLVALGIVGFSLLATLIVFLLPSRV
jgi:hypothetical protein